jgi:hypothetical protein
MCRFKVERFIVPLENKDWVPSFNILKWQAESCGYRLIRNENQKRKESIDNQTPHNSAD